MKRLHESNRKLPNKHILISCVLVLFSLVSVVLFFRHDCRRLANDATHGMESETIYAPSRLPDSRTIAVIERINEANIVSITPICWCLQLQNSTGRNELVPPLVIERVCCVVAFWDFAGHEQWVISLYDHKISSPKQFIIWERPISNILRQNMQTFEQKPTDEQIAAFLRGSMFGFLDFDNRKETLAVRLLESNSSVIQEAISSRLTPEEEALKKRRRPPGIHVYRGP